MMAESQVDFSTVTEIGGAKGSRAQVARACNRYYFAGQFCDGKDVLEAACGVGQGLGYLARRARSVVGLDIEDKNLVYARRTYAGRPSISLRQGDAQKLPFPDASLDVVILYEAIYYLPDAARFAAEARRVLRSGGRLVICTANKDLEDFNPSPFTHRYYGPPEMRAMLEPLGFTTDFMAEDPVGPPTLKRIALQTVKKAAVRWHLIPKTMRGKELIKRIVFGGLVDLPAEILEGMAPYKPPTAISGRVPDREHRVLYAVARLKE